jgi:proton-dependent oligopeptide transporter, POT family
MLTNAFGAALAAAIAPFAKDPNLVWLYTGLSIATLCTGFLFWFSFRKNNFVDRATGVSNASEQVIRLEELSPLSARASTLHASNSDD